MTPHDLVGDGFPDDSYRLGGLTFEVICHPPSKPEMRRLYADGSDDTFGTATACPAESSTWADLR